MDATPRIALSVTPGFSLVLVACMARLSRFHGFVHLLLRTESRSKRLA
jgi:hypothetical protein